MFAHKALHLNIPSAAEGGGRGGWKISTRFSRLNYWSIVLVFQCSFGRLIIVLSSPPIHFSHRECYTTHTWSTSTAWIGIKLFQLGHHNVYNFSDKAFWIHYTLIHVHSFFSIATAAEAHGYCSILSYHAMSKITDKMLFFRNKVEIVEASGCNINL